MSPAVRAIVQGVAFLAGVAAGVLGSFVHGYQLHGVPVGLLVALALSFVVFGTAGLTVRARSGALAAASGWLLAVAYLSLQRPEGDLVVPASTLGYLWLFGGTAVSGVAIAVPYTQWSARDRSAPEPSAGAPTGR